MANCAYQGVISINLTAIMSNLLSRLKNNLILESYIKLEANVFEQRNSKLSICLKRLDL